jgi:predicted alpha/beta hydrolase family esterase
MVPKLETNKTGPTIDYENSEEIPFEKVYVASHNDSV